MAAAPKRARENEDNFFSYSNTLELTFGKKPRIDKSSKNLPCRKKGDFDSSSSSESDNENGFMGDRVEIVDSDSDDEERDYKG